MRMKFKDYYTEYMTSLFTAIASNNRINDYTSL